MRPGHLPLLSPAPHSWTHSSQANQHSMDTALDETTNDIQIAKCSGQFSVLISGNQDAFEIVNLAFLWQLFLIFLFTGTVISPPPPFFPLWAGLHFQPWSLLQIKAKRRFVDVEYARSWRERDWKRDLSRWVSKCSPVEEIGGLWKFYKRNSVKLRRENCSLF